MDRTPPAGQQATPADVRVREARYEDDAALLRAVRHAVFVLGQGVPAAVEWDGQDARCVHVLAEHAGEPVGTARMLPDGRIGRMAVLRSWRGRGIGGRLLQELLRLAEQRGARRVFLNAQLPVMGFYARHGFVTSGAPFEEAGMPHVRMVLQGTRVEHGEGP